MSKDESIINGLYCYRYPRPAVTCDCVIFGFDGNELKILLIERKLEPFKGYWALPGGFMRMDETIEQCAARELKEETNVENVYLEQFEVFSSTDRDPRGRVVTVAFIALVRPSDYRVIGGDDAERAAWFNSNMLPPVAFDHQEIIDKAKVRLTEILRLRPVAFQLLDEIFSVDDLRKVYEAVNKTQYDRRNFQRKLMQSNIVEELNELSLSEDMDDCSNLVSNDNRDCCKLELPPRASKLDFRSSPGRRPNKLFRLKGLFSKKEDNDENDNDNSIKDLFNF